MSLKAFHVFFVIVSILMLVFFGVWGVREYMETKDIVPLVMGIISFQAVLLLAWYFQWFLRKLKNLSYL